MSERRLDMARGGYCMSRWLRMLTCTLFCVTPVAHALSPPDILVVAQSIDDILSLDPAEGFELSSLQIENNIYQRLVEPDPDHPDVLNPILAASWKTGPITNSLVFELRTTAKFSSGRPLRPEDVIFSLARAVRMNRAPVFILNELGWNAGNIDRALIRVDATHVQLNWYAHIGPALALSILTSPVASILDATEATSHAAPADGSTEAAGNAWLKLHSAGSGPFTIRRYLPREALVLQVNPYAAEPPSLKTIVIRNVADAATRRLLVEAGDADIARDLGPDQIAALAGKTDLKTLEFPSATVDYLLLNAASTTNSALGNPALWEAARWLIDYQGIADHLLKGEYRVHQAFLASGFPGALDDTPYHLDVDKAKSILKGAGLAAGLTIRLEIMNQPPYVDIAQSLQATFAAAGIRLEIVPELASQVYANLRARNVQASWLYWVPDYYDANSSAGAFALNREDGTKTLAWRAGWHIPQLTAQVQAAALEENPQTRLAEYRAIQADVQRNSPCIVALQARSEVVMRKNVAGYRQNLDAEMVYYDRVTK
jgi:peptide/nickel transport system substrate-binding protein